MKALRVDTKALRLNASPPRVVSASQTVTQQPHIILLTKSSDPFAKNKKYTHQCQTWSNQTILLQPSKNLHKDL